MPTADAFTVVQRLSEVNSRLGLSSHQVALSWLLHQPGVASILVGATTAEQAMANAAAAVTLTSAQISSVAAPNSQEGTT